MWFNLKFLSGCFSCWWSRRGKGCENIGVEECDDSELFVKDLIPDDGDDSIIVLDPVVWEQPADPVNRSFSD